MPSHLKKEFVLMPILISLVLCAFSFVIGIFTGTFSFAWAWILGIILSVLFFWKKECRQSKYFRAHGEYLIRSFALDKKIKKLLLWDAMFFFSSLILIVVSALVIQNLSSDALARISDATELNYLGEANLQVLVGLYTKLAVIVGIALVALLLSYSFIQGKAWSEAFGDAWQWKRGFKFLGLNFFWAVIAGAPLLLLLLLVGITLKLPVIQLVPRFLVFLVFALAFFFAVAIIASYRQFFKTGKIWKSVWSAIKFTVFFGWKFCLPFLAIGFAIFLALVAIFPLRKWEWAVLCAQLLIALLALVWSKIYLSLVPYGKENWK